MSSILIEKHCSMWFYIKLWSNLPPLIDIRIVSYFILYQLHHCLLI